MEPLFILAGAQRRSAEVEAWFAGGDPLQALARTGFERLRALGPDVAEVLHDRMPTACVDGAAFAYVGAFSAHAAVGFFHGAALADPARRLVGTGKRMRHVKLVWGARVDEAALAALIAAAYADIRARVGRPL